MLLKLQTVDIEGLYGCYLSLLHTNCSWPALSISMFERFILLIVALFAVVCNAEPEPAKIEQSRLAFIEKLYDENVDLFRQTFAATGVSEEEIAELSEKHQLSIDF